MNWTIIINGERMFSDKCPHLYVESPGAGHRITNWYACGHPSAIGCPCSSWACPIRTMEVSDD